MAATEILNALKENAVLRAAPGPALQTLTGQTRWDELPRDHLLYQRGDPATEVLVLASGRVRVFQTHAESELLTTHVDSPSTFGEMEVIAEAAGAPARGYLAHAVAGSPIEIVRIPAVAFLSFLDDNPPCARHMLREMCVRGASAATREMSAFFEVPVRLANFLLETAELSGRETADGIQIHTPLSRRDLANALGITEKSVSRTFKVWKKNGWISRAKGWLILHDVAALEEFCGDARFSLHWRYEGDR